FVQDTRERIEVGPSRDLLLGRSLLRAHVVWCAERKTGLRHSSACGCAQCESDSEIHDHRAPVVQENVLGFDVTMYYAMPVCIIERVGNLSCDANGLFDAELCFAIQPLAYCHALDVRHDVEEDPTGRSAVEQRQ